jgi:hypothetical protein
VREKGTGMWALVLKSSQLAAVRRAEAVGLPGDFAGTPCKVFFWRPAGFAAIKCYNIDKWRRSISSGQGMVRNMLAPGRRLLRKLLVGKEAVIYNYVTLLGSNYDHCE